MVQESVGLNHRHFSESDWNWGGSGGQRRLERVQDKRRNEEFRAMVNFMRLWMKTRK